MKSCVGVFTEQHTEYSKSDVTHLGTHELRSDDSGSVLQAS